LNFPAALAAGSHNQSLAINELLRAKVALLSARLSHRNSVCPSHGWIRQKRSKLGSPNLHRRLPGRL